MQKLFLKLVLFFVVFSFIIIFGLPKQGLTRTTVSIGEESCIIDVKVFLAFYGEGATQELADSWEKGAEQIFNAGNWKFGECKCPVSFDILTLFVEEGKACPVNYHCVKVLKIDPKSYHRSSVNTSNWGAWDIDHQIDSGTGKWSNQDSSTVIAHEIGHFIGLDDEYEDIVDDKGNVIGARDKNPQPPGQPPSIMASTNGSVFLQEHIDAMIGGSDVECPDRCCCGNETLDTSKGEQCDPPGLQKTVGHKCGSYQMTCDKKCQWTGSPNTCCGDGVIQTPNDNGQNENCESDKDCKSNEQCCPETCVCRTKTTTTP